MPEQKQDIDGGYAWVVLVASLILYTIIVGTAKSFGILYAEFLTYFGSSAAETAWISGLQYFLFFGLGPIANFLVTRFSFRKVMYCGALLMSVSFLVSSFVREMHLLYITMGVMLGIGYGLIFAPVTTIVNFYFEKWRALANGLVICGSGIGSFCFPYIYRALLNNYGVHGTLMLLSAITLNACVCISLLRQPRNFSSNKTEGFHCLKLFDFTLFKIPTFSIYVFSFFFNTFAFSGNFVVFSAHMQQLGLSKEQITVAFSLIGASELFARAFTGWFADLKIVHPKSIVIFCVGVSAIIAFLIPMFPYYPAMLCYAVCIGTFPGAFWGLAAVLLLECVDLKRLPSAFGVLSLGMAVGIMLSQVIAGASSGVVFFTLMLETIFRHFLGKDSKMQGEQITLKRRRSSAHDKEKDIVAYEAASPQEPEESVRFLDKQNT